MKSILPGETSAPAHLKLENPPQFPASDPVGDEGGEPTVHPSRAGEYRIQRFKSPVAVNSARRGPFLTDCAMNCMSVQQCEYLLLYRFW